MAKFYRDRFPPGFFDLPPDAGEALPLDVIAEWTRSEQTAAAAARIVGPRTLRGTVVSSDSAGLTRLSRERSLIEILALVSRPKELVHAFGVALGGRAIGVWAADNTQMFYGECLAADRIVAMLLPVADRVALESEIGIGLGAHSGEFYLGPATRDVAGSAVNVAAKLAQDCGADGGIYVSQDAAARSGMEGTPVSFERSGISLSAVAL